MNLANLYLAFAGLTGPEAIRILANLAARDPALVYTAMGVNDVPFLNGPYNGQKYLGDGKYENVGLVHGVSYTVYQSCMDSVRAGNKVEGIKTLRTATGLALREAKDEVEGWAAKLGIGR